MFYIVAWADAVQLVRMLICNQLFMIAYRHSLVHGIQCNEPNEQFMRGSVLLKKGEIQIHTYHVY